MLPGHEAAWQAWHAGIASGRMHHAWLLAGPRGLGKGSFARAAAAELVAEAGVRQPDTAAHPDILVLEALPDNDEEARKRDEGKPFKLKRNIAIDQIRRMQARLTTRPTLGKRRVVIVDPADDLEKPAMNALLKSLEEPPQGSLFMLVAHQPGRLLPTVRSRCRVVRFAPWADAEIEHLLQRAAPEADAATRLAATAAARGSPGTALDFVGRELGELHAAMRRILDEGDQAFVLRGALADVMGTRPDRGRQLAAIDLARALLAGALAEAPRERQQRIIAAHAEMARLAGEAPTFNFDPALLVLEIGGLLASAAMPTQPEFRA